jgi:eukaryotic-like serine/threonine-protein kinase
VEKSEQWKKIKEIVGAALERSPDERSDYLRQACGQDDSLRAEIESLLSSYETSFLEQSPAGDVLQSPSNAVAGRRIGTYRIIGECGHGGMAVVYLAERADQQYRKRVAIKMVQPGANHDQILRRFRNERQTLAALDHPNIVKLLDGGSTEEGLPYLVMDYVEGVPIQQYCDGHQLSISQRLQLFRIVCSAVHYAHQKQVIHRDIKPSNVLITNEGVPRLLDFGIAKLLNPECLQTELATGDWRPMTPEYASPEQMRGAVVTQATDIYSLGVLVYELLTGHRPCQATRISGLELERSVCEEDPEKPSTAVGKIEENTSEGESGDSTITPELVAQARNTKPEDLRRRLQGDLDTIVMKALRKEPQRRYASAEEFSDDIERHLSGMPVKARRPTLVYRGGKFLRRHRESVAAVVIAFALMAGFGAWQARRIWKQSSEKESGSVRFRARPSVAVLGFKNLSSGPDTAWLSTALSEMLNTELAAGGQLRAVPGETVARTKIDLALSDAESLASDVLARVRKNLGSDFVVLGSYLDLGGKPGGQIRLDLRLQDTTTGETVAAVSENGSKEQLLDLVSRTGTRLRERLGIGELSSLELVGITASVPSNSEALRSYSQGLAKLRAFDALAARDSLSRAVAIDPAYPLAHSALAKTWLALGYDSNAREQAQKALDNAENLSREDHLLVEALYYEATKQWEKAIETYRTLFSFFPDNPEYGLNLANAQTSGGKGKDALNTLAALARLGAAATDDPRIDLAKSDAASSLGDDKFYRDAAESAAIKAGRQGARLLVARARSSECRAFANLGENDKAAPVCEEARQIYSDLGDRSGLARTLHSMAEIPIDQGDLVAAGKLYEQAFSLAREIGNQQAIGRELIGLGVVAKSQGDYVRALEFYGDSLQYNQKAGNKNGMIAAIGNTANILVAQGKLSEAFAQYKNALGLAEEVGDKSSVALASENMGQVLAEEGDLTGALRVDQEALDTLHEGGQRHYYAGTLVMAGQVLQQQGDLDNAQKNYVAARSMQEQLGEKGPAAATDLALAELDCDSGKAAEAEPLIRAALQQFQAEKDINNEIAAGALLSRSLLQQGKLNQAQQAIATVLTLSGKSRDVTVRMPLEIQDAYVRAAAKDFGGAEHSARHVLAEATQLGFVRVQFEASLALGEIEIKAGDRVAARTRLERVEKNARAKGFELIARKAAAARA